MKVLIKLQRFFLLVLVVLGIGRAIGRNNWLGVWAGLEVNVLGVLPLISKEGGKVVGEVGVKYFLVQACGSSILLFRGVNFFRKEDIFMGLILVSLLWKMGIAPFHTWFIQITRELRWRRFYLLRTVQKTAPLFLMSYRLVLMERDLLYLRVISGRGLGALGGYGEMVFRKVLAFSSVNHIRWLLFILLEGGGTWLIYFFVYWVVLAGVVIELKTNRLYTLNQLRARLPAKAKVGLFSGMLSLGGIPPFLGFIPKWMVLEARRRASLTLSLTVLVVGSVVTLYYYSRLFSAALAISTRRGGKKRLERKKNIKSKIRGFRVFRGIFLVCLYKALL